MSKDIRDRFKTVFREGQDSSDKDDLFSIWDQQKKMKLEDKKISEDLKAAKLKAKELRKTLLKHQLGSASIIKNHIPKIRETLLGFIDIVKRYGPYSYIAIITVSIGLFAFFIGFSKDKKALLGDSTGNNSAVLEDLPRETPRGFDLLFPRGLNEDSFEIVRISPDGNSPSYTYVDTVPDSTTKVSVTQQEIPKDFNLQETATNFQATNIIKVDNVEIYHGYTEKTNVQSLILTKNNLLIFIRSSQKMPDEIWAGYVASLR